MFGGHFSVAAAVEIILRQEEGKHHVVHRCTGNTEREGVEPGLRVNLEVGQRFIQ